MPDHATNLPAEATPAQPAMALPASATEADTLPSAPTATLALPEAPTRDVLVWRHSDDDDRTAWVQLNSAGPTVLAERSGLWCASGDDAWLLELTTRRVAACSPNRCATDFTTCRRVPAKRAAALVTDATWRSLLQGRRVPLEIPLPADVAVRLVASGFATEWTPMAGLDHRLVLRQDWRVRPCGDEESRESTKAWMARVAQGGLLPLTTTTQAEAMLAADGATLDLAWGGGGQTRPTPRWLALQQRLDADGHWQREHVVEMSTPDGEQTTALAAVALPTALAEVALDSPDLRQLPAAVRLSWSRQQQAAGWTWVTGASAQRAELLARFRAH